MKFTILVTLLCAWSAQGLLFPDLTKWTNLRVSWYANPLSSWGFDGVPRTLADNKEQFQLKDDACANGAGKFLGQRYWYKNDPTVILLFDIQGTIAGIQSSILKSEYTPAHDLQQYHIDDGDYWTLTAYFVDPSTICTTGRSAQDLSDQGTGTGLWLQYGTDPVANSVSIPVLESDIKSTKWGYGKCFWTMGQHYWYNVSKSMDCADFVPNCLLYNQGKLTGFCFASNVNVDKESQRYDNPAPTNNVVNKFLDPVPDCFFSDPSYSTLSTVHVYFADEPQLTSFC